MCRQDLHTDGEGRALLRTWAGAGEELRALHPGHAPSSAIPVGAGGDEIAEVPAQ